MADCGVWFSGRPKPAYICSPWGKARGSFSPLLAKTNFLWCIGGNLYIVPSTATTNSAKMRTTIDLQRWFGVRTMNYIPNRTEEPVERLHRFSPRKNSRTRRLTPYTPVLPSTHQGTSSAINIMIWLYIHHALCRHQAPNIYICLEDGLILMIINDLSYSSSNVTKSFVLRWRHFTAT